MKREEILRIFDNDQFCEIYLESEATTLAYERHYRRLQGLMPINENEVILDVGAHHGSSSLELFRRQPRIKVVALDPSKTLLDVSKAKFQGTGIERLLAKYAHNGAVVKYLADQYQECSTHGNNISYCIGFAEDIDGMNIGKFDHVFGSMGLHWLVDPIKAFSNFNNVLKKGGTVATASHAWKYRLKDPQLDRKSGCDDAPFVKKFYENLDRIVGYEPKEQALEEGDLWDYEKVVKLLEETGFELIAYEEDKKPITLGHVIMSCKAGAFYTNADRLSSVNSAQFLDTIREALLRTMTKIDPLDSVEYYFNICPYIVGRKV